MGYYYGLASRPKLVARSSTDPWAPRSHVAAPFPLGKLLNPVGRHPIADLWNTDGPLRQYIVRALDGVEWTTVDVLRLGYQLDMSLGTAAREPEHHPVTLLISVREDSTSWEQGHAVVTQCHEILQQHGICDVHCEMKESHTSPLASLPSAPMSAPKLHSGDVDDPININGLFSAYLGHCISTLDDPTVEGTKCLHLRRKDTGHLLALTCRHVVIPKTAANEDYTFDASNLESRIAVIQPGDETLLMMKKDISTDIESMQTALETLEKNTRKSPDAKARGIDAYLAILSGYQETERKLNELEERSSRIIGHVLFSPKYSTGPRGTNNTNRLRDWALIELHPAKHESPLETLRNLVSVPKDLPGRLSNALGAEGYSFKPTVAWDLLTSTVEIQGTIPETELRRPRHEAHSLDEPAILVAKYGRSTEFTLGVANQATSIRREPIDGIFFTSEEWCILGQKMDCCGKGQPFSAPGDSGSCVWDVQGRIGGMVTASNNIYNQARDTTFATPIEWLLEDIKAYGYDVELVGGEDSK